jgi:predicted alpha/beta-fold hydrolase
MSQEVINLKRHEIVKITWCDITSIDEWSSKEEVLAYSPHHIVTYGILIGETDSHYITASNLDLVSEDVSCCMIIPRACLVKPIEVIRG